MKQDRDTAEVPCGTPVDRHVRPAAWLSHYKDANDGTPLLYATTSYELARENDATGSPAPLYGQDAIDAAVSMAHERYSDLMLAVEWMLADDGNMTQEHLARIRAAWERA